MTTNDDCEGVCVTVLARRVRSRLAMATDTGFTLIEQMVTILIISVAFTAMMFALHSALNGLGAARQRSIFLEVAQGEIEKVRSTPYDFVGVRDTDPNRSAAYPGGQFEGRDEVVVTGVPATATVPAAVEVVSTSDLRGVSLPYTVRRWVTWTDVNGGATHEFKRLTVDIEYLENNRILRRIRLSSVLYPGNLGTGSFSVNQSPNIVYIVTPTDTALAGISPVQFDGTLSSDPDGDVLAYRFDFGDGTPAAFGGPSTTFHTFTTPGVYTTSLTIVDGRGGSASAVVDVKVLSATNNPPTANATAAPTNGAAPLTVAFDGSGSFDDPPNATPSSLMTYRWNFGDGSPEVTGQITSHTFTATGEFNVVMTVTDAGGLSDTTSLVVTVGCSVISSSFHNDWNSLGPEPDNDVKVNTSNKPDNRNFVFSAQTNDQCSTLRVRLPYLDRSGNTAVPVFLDVAMTQVGSPVNGVQEWVGSGGLGQGNDTMDTGRLTADVASPDFTTPQIQFSYGFVIHT